MAAGALNGTKVVVLGAGLAGLAGARALELDGAAVVVIEARDRVGGRVHTLRAGLAHGQHAEAGADLIESAQNHTRGLASEMGLNPVRILRRGWGFYGPDNQGHPGIRRGPNAFQEAARLLTREIADYQLADGRWDSAIAARLARRSVAEWMTLQHADTALQSGLRGLRGFFLADPEDLSLIALVDELASTGQVGSAEPADDRVFRLPGGNDTLPAAIANSLHTGVKLQHAARRVTATPRGVVVMVEDRGTQLEIEADYCVSAMPASTLRDMQFEPALPEAQQRAIATLKYGRATRVVLQFARRFWRRATRPSAFGSDLPTGAVWDGNEEQGGRPGILSLLAGGQASVDLQAILMAEGHEGVARRLGWMASSGVPAKLLGAGVVTWEKDPWAKGGYAVFDPTFDPALRPWLARPAGRILFAGEHTSTHWQGYMNGAVESGRRAAAEVRALAQA
jgi:monoamine oxidase